MEFSMTQLQQMADDIVDKAETYRDANICHPTKGLAACADSFLREEISRWNMNEMEISALRGMVTSEVCSKIRND